MGKRKPFTLVERRRWSQDFGYRYVNNWGGGDLPAPFAAGDVVRLVRPFPRDEGGYDRLRGQEGPFFVVTYGPSIDEGDAWYFRVSDGEHRGSDRLHVSYPDRSTWSEAINYMESFDLVETIDSEGLALRDQMIRDGWTMPDSIRPCPACGGRGTVA